MVVTDAGQPRRVDVPVELPEGVSREGTVGSDEEDYRAGFSGGAAGKPTPAVVNTVSSSTNANLPVSKPPVRRSRSSGRKDKSGVGAGSGGGYGAGNKSNLGGGGDAPGSPRQMSEDVRMVDGAEVERPLTKEEKQRQALAAKLHPTILALVDRLKNRNAPPGANEATFVHDGKAEVQVWLVDKTPAALAALKQLGFEVVLDPQTARLVIGRISLDKLAALAELKEVRYISPQT